MTFLETFISFNVMEHTGLSFYNMKKRREAMNRTIFVLLVTILCSGLFVSEHMVDSRYVPESSAVDILYCGILNDWLDDLG